MAPGVARNSTFTKINGKSSFFFLLRREVPSAGQLILIWTCLCASSGCKSLTQNNSQPFKPTPTVTNGTGWGRAERNAQGRPISSPRAPRQGLEGRVRFSVSRPQQSHDPEHWVERAVWHHRDDFGVQCPTQGYGVSSGSARTGRSGEDTPQVRTPTFSPCWGSHTRRHTCRRRCLQRS